MANSDFAEDGKGKRGRAMKPPSPGTSSMRDKAMPMRTASYPTMAPTQPRSRSNGIPTKKFHVRKDGL